jgi:hypothetical protein
MLGLLHYQENGANKGSQMGHTRKIFKKGAQHLKQRKKIHCLPLTFAIILRISDLSNEFF